MSATLSPCGKYRYLLTRGNLDLPLVFCMLNPSTADADKDDPTIRRCVRFAKDWGYSGIVVVNLFAYRATKPDELTFVEDPIGPYNDAFIKGAVVSCPPVDVICAWGSNAPAGRAAEVTKLLQDMGANLCCLGTTAKGMPRHPLYVRADCPMYPYPPEFTK